MEPYIETHMSDANREQVQTYLSSLWGNIVKGISASRNIPVEKINQITDDFKIYPTEEFVKEGFLMEPFTKTPCSTNCEKHVD